MDNPRNERSLIIITTYLIGFVSAFIFFGLGEKEELADQENNLPTITQTSTAVTEVTADIPTDFSTKPHALTSSQNNYTFYCENEDPSATYCQGYIYSSEDKKVYPISIDGQPLTIGMDLLDLVKWSDRGLAIGEVFSANVIQPWFLTTNNTPIDLHE